MNKINPITYKEVIEKRGIEIPDSVIEIVNTLIIENFNAYKKRSKVYVDEIIERSSLSYKEFKDTGWINLEDVYEDAGWNVEYFSPDVCDVFSPYFEFTKID